MIYGMNDQQRLSAPDPIISILFSVQGNKIIYPPYIGQATYWRVAGAVTVLYINNVKR
jgi:hypothetical protein